MAPHAHILVVEDEAGTADMLTVYFEAQGYEITAVSRGTEALTMVSQTVPDLILLDVALPDIDGFEVCRRLRAHWRTERIPVIFLTDRRSREDRLTGLELGAVDYIIKPYEVQELRLKVRNVLWGIPSHHPTDAVTGLPDSGATVERLTHLLSDQGWAVLYIGVHDLESYIEAYGFVAGYNVLRAVGRMVSHVVNDVGSPDDFVGHCSGDDLVIITAAERSSTLHRRLEETFEQAVAYFGPRSAWEHVFTRSVRSPEGDAPPVTFSIGLVSGGEFSNTHEMIQAAMDACRYVGVP